MESIKYYYEKTLSGGYTWNTNYYFSNSYSYTSNKYSLSDPYKISSTDDYSSLIGKYTLQSTSDTTSSTKILYITAATESYIYGIELSSGNNLDYYNCNFTYGDSYTDLYIKARFYDEINIDKTYKLISNNLYVGNYLGFKDYSTLEKFNSLDLYNLYFTDFPDKIAEIFGFILIFLYILLIAQSVQRFLHKDVPNEPYNRKATLKAKLYIIIVYSIFWIGYFIYTVYKYDNIFNKLRHDELLEIKADPFFEDLLKEIYNANPKTMYILFISLYVVSMAIFIFAWILSHYFTKQYLQLVEKTQPNLNNQLISQ